MNTIISKILDKWGFTQGRLYAEKDILGGKIIFDYISNIEAGDITVTFYTNISDGRRCTASRKFSSSLLVNRPIEAVERFLKVQCQIVVDNVLFEVIKN